MEQWEWPRYRRSRRSGFAVASFWYANHNSLHLPSLNALALSLGQSVAASLGFQKPGEMLDCRGVQPRALTMQRRGGSDRLGRLKDPGGMGPAAYGLAQEGGDPVDIDQYAWTEVTSS